MAATARPRVMRRPSRITAIRKTLRIAQDSTLGRIAARMDDAEHVHWTHTVKRPGARWSAPGVMHVTVTSLGLAWLRDALFAAEPVRAFSAAQADRVAA